MTIKENLGFEKNEEFDISKAIDYYLNNKEQRVTERDYFYVSELGQTKKEIYDKIVNKKPFVCDARVKRILDNGNYVHERITKLFAEMGILTAAEIEVNTKLVHGRLDCIITDGEKNYIVEIKSCSMWTFNKLKEPSIGHLLQIQFYMYYTNIENGIILYESKDDQKIKCVSIKLDRELVEKCISELQILKKNIDEKIEPKAEPLTINNLEYI